MPTYQNNSTEESYQNDSNHTPVRVAAGEPFVTNYYIPDLPFTITKMSDAPIVR